MVFDLESLQKEYQLGKTYKYVIFWGHTPNKVDTIDTSCFSQWWPCKFQVDEIWYSCAEQYMMAEKARLFEDEEVAEKILKVTHPKQMKELGRLVKDFKQEVWEEHCYEIVKRGNMEKFSQNPELLNYLLNTKGSILVEASPVDKIWGIRMDKRNEAVEIPMKWEGKNLLGFALTEVREAILKRKG